MMQNVFPRLSETPGRVHAIAPQTVGQDNAAVLGGLLGLTAEALEDLGRRGIL